jgi:hypothetical protein
LQSHGYKRVLPGLSTVTQQCDRASDNNGRVASRNVSARHAGEGNCTDGLTGSQ